jgi:hypothetical protein
VKKVELIALVLVAATVLFLIRSRSAAADASSCHAEVTRVVRQNVGTVVKDADSVSATTSADVIAGYQPAWRGHREV